MPTAQAATPPKKAASHSIWLATTAKLPAQLMGLVHQDQ